MHLHWGSDVFTQRQLCVYTEAVMHLHWGNDAFTLRQWSFYTETMMNLQVLMEQIFSFITCHKNLAITTWCRCFYRTATSFHPKSTSTNRRTWANVLVSSFFTCLVIFELTNPGFAVVRLPIQFGICCKLRQELSWSFLTPPPHCLYALNTFWVNKCMYIIIIIAIECFHVWHIVHVKTSIGERNSITKGNIIQRWQNRGKFVTVVNLWNLKQMFDAYKWLS